MDLVLATRNKKKIEEIKRIIEGFKISMLTLNDFPGCPEVIEDGATFEENAIKKAVVIAKYTGNAVLADDSGIEVYALNGAPGILSARYAGKDADDRKNIEKLLSEMQSVSTEQRGARFVCCIALALSEGSIHKFHGYAEGTIGKEPKGVHGFGYDPLFYPDGYNKTFAEMTDEEKDKLSHRGKAIRNVQEFFRIQYTIYNYKNITD
jgi:XTP/dITP diphosphohydrolase